MKFKNTLSTFIQKKIPDFQIQRNSHLKKAHFFQLKDIFFVKTKFGIFTKTPAHTCVNMVTTITLYRARTIYYSHSSILINIYKMSPLQISIFV